VVTPLSAKRIDARFQAIDPQFAFGKAGKESALSISFLLFSG